MQMKKIIPALAFAAALSFAAYGQTDQETVPSPPPGGGATVPQSAPMGSTTGMKNTDGSHGKKGRDAMKDRGVKDSKGTIGNGRVQKPSSSQGSEAAPAGSPDSNQ